MKRLLLLLSVALLIAPAVTSCSKNDDDDTQKRITALSTSLNTVEGQVKEINNTIEKLKDMQSELDGYIKEFSSDGESFGTQIADLQKAKNEIDDQITDLQKSRDTLDSQMKALRQAGAEYSSRIKALQDAGTEYSSQIEALQYAGTECSSRIMALQNDTDALDRKITALQSATDALDSTITALQSADSTFVIQLEALRSRDDLLDRNIADLKNYAEGLQSEAKDWAETTFATLGQMATLSADIFGIQSNVGSLYSAVSELSGQMTAMGAEVTGIQSDLGTLQSITVPEIQNGLGSLGSLVGGIEEQLSSLGLTVGEMQGQLGPLGSAVQDMQGQLGSLGSTVGNILDQLASLDVSVIEDRVTQLENNMPDLETDIKPYVDNKVAELENSLKEWVNEQLATGYVTIASLEVSLNDLWNRCDAALADSLAILSGNLESAKAQLRQEYQAAIQQAVANQGEINQGLQSQITAANTNLGTLQSRINALSTRLVPMEEDIRSLKERIQSVVVIPTYSDGSVLATEGVNTVSFRVTPISLVDTIANVWEDTDEEDRSSIVQVMLESVRTKSGAVSVSVEDVYAYNGKLNVRMQFSGKPASGTVASLHIVCGINDVMSGYFPIYSPEYPEAPDMYCSEVNGLWWAPVNCGYSSYFPYGRLYQWGRKYGQAYDDDVIVVNQASTMLEGQELSNDIFFYKWGGSASGSNWYSGEFIDDLWCCDEKGEFDPCPEGWRVPTRDEFVSLIGGSYLEGDFTNQTHSVGGDTQYGHWFDGSGDEDASDGVFLPAAGYRHIVDGEPYSLGEEGSYWTSNYFKQSSYFDALALTFSSDFLSFEDYFCAYGFSVRCVME